MSETDFDRPDLGRLQEDLATIREAGRFDKPYSAEDVPLSILLAVTGLVIVLAGWLFPFNRLVVLAGFIPFVIVFARLTWRRQQNRALRPGLWRETRNSLVAVVIILPLVVAWMKWRELSGIAPHVAGAAGVFFIGVGCMVLGVIERDRRSYIAAGAALLGFGLAIPFLERSQITMAAGLAVFAAGLGGAVIIAIQMKETQSIE